jgi:Symplekin tight junction protein C terminal
VRYCCCAVLTAHATAVTVLLLTLLSQILRADKAIVEAAFKRLVSPLSSSSSSATRGMYTPAELLALLHNFDCAAAAVPMKKITEAVSICLDNKAVYRYHTQLQTAMLSAVITLHVNTYSAAASVYSCTS